MAPQKSERGVVPQDRRKAVPTDPRRRGGKAAPVNEQTGQLQLHFGTAENPAAQPAVGATDRAEADPSVAARHAVPKPKGMEKKVTSVTMEAVCERLEVAFLNVASNQGAPGPDRQSIAQVRAHLSEILPVLKTELLNGTYAPGNIRRVWIEKAGGGQRGLGIPNVIDRVVQEAVRGVLEPLYEPTFHEASHGFRPGRSGHTAIAAARAHVEDGYEFVVDLDL